jgi:hypothetical protein
MKAPTLAQQIYAVEWAALRINKTKGVDTTPLRESEKEFMEAALAAAAKGLRRLETMQETLK